MLNDLEIGDGYPKWLKEIIRNSILANRKPLSVQIVIQWMVPRESELFQSRGGRQHVFEVFTSRRKKGFESERLQSRELQPIKRGNCGVSSYVYSEHQLLEVRKCNLTRKYVIVGGACAYEFHPHVQSNAEIDSVDMGQTLPRHSLGGMQRSSR